MRRYRVLLFQSPMPHLFPCPAPVDLLLMRPTHPNVNPTDAFMLGWAAELGFFRRAA